MSNTIFTLIATSWTLVYDEYYVPHVCHCFRALPVQWRWQNGDANKLKRFAGLCLDLAIRWAGSKPSGPSTGPPGIDSASRAIGTKIATIMPLNKVNKMGENRTETKGQLPPTIDSLGIDRCRNRLGGVAALAGRHGQRYLSPSQSLASQYRLNSQLKPLEGRAQGVGWRAVP